jgi:cytochrome c oxidase subunit 3
MVLWRRLTGWSVNPASAFFTLICAFHGLHVVGGLAAWMLAGRRLLAGAAPEAARAVQLCARYWEFMLLVWLVMMGLFVST